MNHLSEEQIVLHYYGDADDKTGITKHLGECQDCRREFERVTSLLTQIEPIEVPEPGVGFEDKIWLKLRDDLPQKQAWQSWLLSPKQWALAGSMIALLMAAFAAGRFWPRSSVTTDHTVATAKDSPISKPNNQVVLVAVGNHLEQSEMLLVEIMNADGSSPLDLSAEQGRARDLLDANHLYRVSAQQSGDPKIAHLLDELGGVLAELANSPDKLSQGDLKEIRGRIESEGLIFKVRVVGSDVNSRVRRRQQSAAANTTQRL